MYIVGFLVVAIIVILIIGFANFLKFVAFTIGVAAVGVFTSGWMSEILGSVIILFSPVIAGAGVFFTRPRKEDLEKRAEQELQTRRETQQEKQDNADHSKQDRQEFIRSGQKQLLINAIDQHHAVLSHNMEHAIIRNDYGKILKDNSNEIIEEFLASINLVGYELDFYESKKIIREHLKAKKHKNREKGFDLSTLPTDGLAFEHWVADGLKIYGWDAKATSGSGDQGIDVIAIKDGKRVGLQCKLFSSPVGNKAVQEAFAGNTFHKTDAVAVISNASYTPSAKKLAADTDVKLLSHHDIPDLYKKMFGA